jgi:hypothetical protein
MAVLSLLRHYIGSEYIESVDLPEVQPLEDGDLGYNTVLHYPFIDDPTKKMSDDVTNIESNFGFAGVIPRTRLFFLPKSCFWTGNWETQRQIIGLTPKNFYTMEIERQLLFWRNTWSKDKGYFLQIVIKYFESPEAMFAYVADPEYMTDSDNHRGLCFGISMAKNNSSEFLEYEFNFHFDD